MTRTGPSLAGSYQVSDDLDVRRAFERDMVAIYDSAKRAGYNATRFLVMVREHGGLETAHRLLAAADISYGFTELWMLGRQDLTVEALVLMPQYQSLFAPEELRTARDRLGVAETAEPDGSARKSPGGEIKATTTWTLERYQRAASERGAIIESLVARFATWVGTHPDSLRLGEGSSGPMYFAPRAANGDKIPVVSLSLEGRVEVLLNNLAAHPPFDRIAKRIELQRRLNAILGLEVSDVATEAATWHSIDAAYLLSPGAFGQFTEAFEWVAEQLATSETGG